MKLIIFDKEKNIRFFGESKLQFIKTKIEKCLKFVLIDKESDETLTSTFDRTYIRKSNFLCCLAEKESNPAFIAVFSNQESCQQIFDAVFKATSKQPSQSNDSINEDETFKDIFFIPLIKQIHAGINDHTNLKAIILDFVYSLHADEQFVFLKLLAETLLIPCSHLFKEANNDINGQNGGDVAELHVSGDTNLNVSSNNNKRKRSINNAGLDENNDKIGRSNKLSCRKSIVITRLNEPSPKNSPDDVIFDIVECQREGKLVKIFLIFTSPERTQCYEYFCHSNLWYYRCIKCLTQDKSTVIKATIHDNGSRTFHCNTQGHVCEPIDYVPSNYQTSLIIKSPNFKFTQHKWRKRMMPLLIIFNSDAKDCCYRFGYESSNQFFRCLQCRKHGMLCTARFIHHEGQNAIELGHAKHICQPQKYIP